MIPWHVGYNAPAVVGFTSVTAMRRFNAATAADGGQDTKSLNLRAS